jgi:hypothetical protein
LNNDPSERKNLAKEKPDVVDGLRMKFMDWDEKLPKVK